MENYFAPRENRTRDRPPHILITVLTALPRLLLRKTPVLHSISVQYIERPTCCFHLPDLHGIRGVIAGTRVFTWAVPNWKIARGVGHRC